MRNERRKVAARPSEAQRRRLQDWGETRLIARLVERLPPEPSWVVVGRGTDDAAALDLGGRELVLVTCDALLEGRHFRRDWISARQLGRRAASVNLSDIAAMGGRPKAAVASLALPRSLEVGYFDDLMRGLAERLEEYGAAVVGGNLAESRARISVDVTLLGTVGRRRLARRSGARPGDWILVTGWPGESAAGLELLRRGRGRARSLSGLLQRHLDPTPRVEEGRALAAHGVTSMIDVSDGLGADLSHLCDESGVGAELDLERLPVSPSLRLAASSLHAPPSKWILGGGEDYELLCTAPPSRVPGLRRALGRISEVRLTEVGVVLPEVENRWVRSGSRRIPLGKPGFQHFANGRMASQRGGVSQSHRSGPMTK